MNLLLYFGMLFWGISAAKWVIIGVLVLMFVVNIYFIFLGQFASIIDFIIAVIFTIIFWKMGFPLRSFAITRFILITLNAIGFSFLGQFSLWLWFIADLIGMILILVNF